MALDDSESIQVMVEKMKNKFDMYWGECNLLMSLASISDPRYKMRSIKFFFPRLYLEHDSSEKTASVRDALYELYGEYVKEYELDSELNNEKHN